MHVLIMSILNYNPYHTQSNICVQSNRKCHKHFRSTTCHLKLLFKVYVDQNQDWVCIQHKASTWILRLMLKGFNVVFNLIYNIYHHIYVYIYIKYWVVFEKPYFSTLNWYELNFLILYVSFLLLRMLRSIFRKRIKLFKWTEFWSILSIICLLRWLMSILDSFRPFRRNKLANSPRMPIQISKKSQNFINYVLSKSRLMYETWIEWNIICALLSIKWQQVILEADCISNCSTCYLHAHCVIVKNNTQIEELFDHIASQRM